MAKTAKVAPAKATKVPAKAPKKNTAPVKAAPKMTKAPKQEEPVVGDVIRVQRERVTNYFLVTHVDIITMNGQTLAAFHGVDVVSNGALGRAFRAKFALTRITVLGNVTTASTRKIMASV